MKRSVMIVFLLLITSLLFPGQIPGLRTLHVNDKIPATDALEILNRPGKKMLLYIKSTDTKSIAFLKILLKQLQLFEKSDNQHTVKDLTLFLVDAGQERDERVPALLKTFQLKTNVQVIDDSQRKIYGQLGIIIVPSLLFIQDDNTFHSLAAGLKKNLSLFIHNYLRALIAGQPAQDVYQSTDRNLVEHQIAKEENQAFLLMINQDYSLAHTMYVKALKEAPDDIEAQLGVGYSLLFMEKIEEALAHFEALKDKVENKRILLGYTLCHLIKSPPTETTGISQPFDQLVHLAQLEPNYFMVIYKSGEILQNAGNFTQSNTLFQHSYQVLLRFLRRSKLK